MKSNKKQVIISFSGGKDSMLALHRMSENKDYEIVQLFTTVNQTFRRTSIHGVREEILDAQAESLGIPLKKVYIPVQCTNAEYEQLMEQEMKEAKEKGIEYVVFGDIFLEDIRKYRENHLNKAGIHPLFPLWGENTSDLMDDFLSLGYETWITTIDEKKVPREFLGKKMDRELVRQLPEHVDICGENGEFHTVVVNGPLFRQPVPVKPGDQIVEDDFYVYRDIVFS